MILLQAALLLLFGFFAAIVVREDLAFRKIRNTRIVAGLWVCLAGYALQFLVTAAGETGLVGAYLHFRFYPAAVQHVLWSFLAAVALWLLDIWPAGDAKLFLVCAAAVPLVEPNQRAFPNYLFLHLLTNIFVLASLYVAGDLAVAVVRSVAQGRAGPWAGAAGRVSERWRSGWAGVGSGWGRYAALGFNMAALFAGQAAVQQWARGWVASWLGNPGLAYAVLFLLWERVSPLAASPRLGRLSAVIAAAAAAAGFLWEPAATWAVLRAGLGRLAGFGLFLTMARAFVEHFLAARAAVTVGADELRPGMVLSAESVSLVKSDPVYFREHISPLFRDGLSGEQVTALRHWLIGLPKGRATVRVLRGNAFAPWIFAGTAFTFAFPRDAASLLLSLLR